MAVAIVFYALIFFQTIKLILNTRILIYYRSTRHSRYQADGVNVAKGAEDEEGDEEEEQEEVEKNSNKVFSLNKNREELMRSSCQSCLQLIVILISVSMMYTFLHTKY